MKIWLLISKYQLGGSDKDKNGNWINVSPKPYIRCEIWEGFHIASTLISDAFSNYEFVAETNTVELNGKTVILNRNFEVIYKYISDALNNPKKSFYTGLNNTGVEFRDYNCYFDDDLNDDRNYREIISIKTFQYILKRWEEELTKFNKDKDAYASPLVEQIEWDENDPLKEPKVTIIRNTT